MVKLTRYIMIFLCVSLLPQAVWADSAVASLDRSITSWGESVVLQIRVNGSADHDPDLSLLSNDFDVLSQSQSSSYSLINGTMSRSKTWSINMMPKRQGRLEIPAISLGNLHTQPLSLQVLPASQASLAQAKDIYLDVSANAQEVYVQAQLVLTVKLFRAVNLAQAELSEFDIAHATIKKMGDDKNYETVRDQRRFVVTERRYAVFPEQSGIMHVPALQFTGQVVSQGSLFSQAGRVVRIQSKSLDIRVRPIPQAWPQGKPWLAATDLTIQEIPPEHQTPFKVGEPFTRTIEIRAAGLTAEQLPDILGHASLHGFKQYPDKPELITKLAEHGLVAIRREKVAMIPTQAGDMQLPAIIISWWNSDTNSLQKAEILPRMITVLPAEKQTKPIGQTASSLKTQQGVSLHPVKPIARPKPSPAEQPQGNLRLWQALAVFFAFAWLVSLFLWWKSSRQHIVLLHSNNSDDTAKTSLKALHKQLEIACKQADAKQVERLLPQWAALFFDNPSIIYMAQLKGHSNMLDHAMMDLENYLYGHSGQTVWQGDKLWKAIVELRKPEKSEEILGLKPLQS